MLTLAAPHRLEVEIKKSRFIARAARADSREAALATLAQVREARANHNCWAFKIGQDYRFNDDGEVSGTAGQPILRAIAGQGLDHVLVVVARHFGGIKLGAGGLVRAYGGTASECLRLAPQLEVRPLLTVRIEAPFDVLGAIYPLLAQSGARQLKEEYTAAGIVLEVGVGEDLLASFTSSIRDATRGRAQTLVVGAAHF